MDRAGLLTRTRQAPDRRVVWVRLTPAGRDREDVVLLDLKLSARCASHTGVSSSPSPANTSPYGHTPNADYGHVHAFTAAHLRAFRVEAGPGWSVDVHEHHGGWVVFDRLRTSLLRTNHEHSRNHPRRQIGQICSCRRGQS